jgi:hypothetical protein
MSKFNTATGRTSTGPIMVSTTPDTITAQGGQGYSRDAKSDLFLLAVTNMVGQDTFYEGATERDLRFRELIHAVAPANVEWMKGFIGWLRNDANMRSASVVAAAETAKAMLDAGLSGSRPIIASALLRPDEPGEMLAYWTSRYGRSIPKPVKRGVADAVQRLYTERAILKYDGATKGYRFGDVLDLTHPEPSAPWQGDLFKYALDRRHNRTEIVIPESLELLRNRSALAEWTPEQRRGVLTNPKVAGIFENAGMTWESLAGWLNGPVDKAAWEAIIPSMGYMALIRNLRNFDEAGVSDEVAATVIAKLTDPDEVLRSRQLPMRFLSAYKAAPSLRWAAALEKALDLSLVNVPVLSGRSLILWDCSGSMYYGMGGRSTLQRYEVAGVFCAALALRAASATLVQYGNAYREVPVSKGGAILKLATSSTNMGGTDTWGTVSRTFAGHDRIIIVTDEQSHDSYSERAGVPASTPIYTWNVAGYAASHAPSGKNRWTFGGLTDQGFTQLSVLESGGVGRWPWETSARD